MTDGPQHSEPSPRQRLALVTVWAVAVFALDWISKWAAVQYLEMRPLGVSLIPGCLKLEFSLNDGIAFGLLQGHSGLLSVLAPLALCVLGVYLWKTFGRHPSAASTVVMGLMLGGALGNIWSRWIDGYVVDFILAYVGTYRWPTFNLADSALCVGVGLALWILANEPDEPDMEEAAEVAGGPGESQRET